MDKLTWLTEQRKIRDLTPAEYNPRQMTEAQAKELRKSLEKFNLVEIPAVDTDGTILAGHQRLAMLTQMGRGDELIDVRVPNRKLTEAEAQEYNLRSNKNTGEWDMDKLFAMPEGLLEEVGFSNKEIQKLVDGHTEVEEDGYDVAVGLDLPLRVAKGEIWGLDGHRLMCGDSTVKEDVERLMDGKKAYCILTDPPYGMKLDADYSGMKGWHQGKKYEQVIGDEKDFDYQQFAWINAKEEFWWGADYYVETLPSFGKDGSWMVWDKRVDESKDKMFGSGFEMLWSKVKHQRRLLRQMWAGFMGDAEASKRVHPTQKPSKLMAGLVNEFTVVGDIVLDLFLGSGSTLIACEQTGRICYGSEIDPKYCSVILDRWMKLTNKMAFLVEDVNGKLPEPVSYADRCLDLDSRKAE